jgi:uncharacterized membrane protein
MISQIRWGFAGALVLSELALWLASDVWYHVPQDEIVEIAIFALLALIAVLPPSTTREINLPISIAGFLAQAYCFWS